MSDVVQSEKRGPVSVIWVDNPPVNALSQAVRAGLVTQLGKAAADPDVRAIVLACRGRTFIAGADISEFGKAHAEPNLPSVIEAYEQCEKPVIAALHGTALGGGLEVALGCHYRVASPSAKCGLPEVKLGLIPGAGGTQRLPRVVGVPKALEIITSGNPIGAREAQTLGLVDRLIDGDLVEGAVAYAEEVADARPLPKVRDKADLLEAARSQPDFWKSASRDLEKRARGARAPLRCLEAVRAAVELPFDEGLSKERALFLEAVQSDESKAMRHAFFAERTAAKVPGIDSATPTIEIRKVAVIGAGTMGAGIAMVFANAGIPALLIDREQSYVDKGFGTIEKNYGATVKKGRLSEEQMAERLALITPTTSWDDIASVDLVIEAVFEDMAIKKEIFSRLDGLCHPRAILATNTSTLDVDEIARATKRPEQVIGLHFFSPANVMRLLEVVRGARTSPSVVATAMQLSKRVGKVGVLVGVCYGFVGNRMLHQYYREANFVLQEGASPEQVDRVMTRFGMAMGPCATSDLAGIDVGWRIRKAKGPPPAGQRYFGAVPDRLAEMGRFGQKTSKGFYRYEAGNRAPIPDPEVDAVIEQVAKELGIERRSVPDDEILERCLYAMINEGAKILEEGIALRASDIDTVWLNGYGFPAHRGGPMFYADQVGLAKIVERIGAFEKQFGDVWTIAPLLARLAAEGKTFASLDGEKG